MKIKISTKAFFYILFCVLLMMINWIGLSVLTSDSLRFLQAAILLQFITFIIMFIALGKANDSYITLYSVFMVIFYLFQNGQLLLYALGVDFDTLYVNKFSNNELFSVIKVSYLNLCAAFIAAVFSFKERKIFLVERLNKISTASLYKASKLFCFATGIIAYVLIAVKGFVWLESGYSGVRAFEQLVPSIIGLLESLFPAFAILEIIAGNKSSYKTSVTTIIFFVWGSLTALIGDRTTGLGVFVIIAIMSYKGCYTVAQKNVNKKMKRRSVLLILTTIFLVSFISTFRNKDEFAIGSVFEIITSVIAELGFSFFPLAAIMGMCPSSKGFLYGKSMFASVIAGFIPESIDIFNVFEYFSDSASIPTHWIANRYQYGFGMDCSLNAEVYANFGYWGFIAMFVICSIIAYLLQNVDYSKATNIFSQYVGLALLFGWFTLPRRRSYYIYNKIFWYILVVAALVIIVHSILKKSERKALNEK